MTLLDELNQVKKSVDEDESATVNRRVTFRPGVRDRAGLLDLEELLDLLATTARCRESCRKT